MSRHHPRRSDAAPTPFPCPWCQATIAPEAACSACSRPLLVCEKFLIHGMLGKGGMGRVYAAKRTTDGQEVAVKVLAPPSAESANTDWTAWELFERSSVVLQQLHNSSLPRVYAFEKTDTGLLLLVREAFDGGTLEERIRVRDSRLEPAKVQALLEGLLHLLAYLQELVPPVIHRDIKPSNVMFRTRDDWNAVLVDFDTIVSKPTGMTIVGTPGYAAPEQFAAEATLASDVYGLGATMLFVATHRDADELPRVEGRFDVDAQLPELGEHLRRVLLRMVEPDVSRRYATARAVLDDLSSRPHPAPPAPVHRAASRFGAFAKAVVLLICGAIALGYVVSRRRSTKGAKTQAVHTNDEATRLERSCTGGNTNDCLEVGLRYDNGTHGLEADPAHAAKLYDKGCSLGGDGSCNNLGVLYEHGKSVPQDFARAAQLYDKACAAKSARGCTNLAELYLAGKGVPKDEATAFELRKTACTLGDAEACDNVGLMAQNGQGTQKDPKRAQTYFGISCDQGYLWGCRNLGIAYEDGIGVMADPLRAASLYKRVCDGNEYDGCYQLGRLTLDGKGADKDPARAAELFGRACDRSIASACTHLGLLYESGRGVPKDEARAARLYRTACDLNEAWGCADLGWDYEHEAGVERDLARASTLDEKGCDGGIGRACRWLGDLYERGELGAVDVDRVKALYQRGCDYDDNESCTRARKPR